MLDEVEKPERQPPKPLSKPKKPPENNNPTPAITIFNRHRLFPVLQGKSS